MQWIGNVLLLLVSGVIGVWGFTANLWASDKIEPYHSKESSARSRTSDSSVIDWDTLDDEEFLRQSYVWGWPLVYMSSVRDSLALVSRAGISGGAPVAPVNRMSMLTRPVDSSFRSVPCPNRDVIYGFSLLDLQETPVIVQVPDFGQRLWLYQLGDHRTDSFGTLGSVHGSAPGFYLIVGPDWNGETPPGIQGVFRSPTTLAYVLPRVFVGSQPHDDAALQASLSQILVYPLSQWSQSMRTQDWSRPKWYPAIGVSSKERSKCVDPHSYFDKLERILHEVPPLPGEESLYHRLASLLKDSHAAPQKREWLREKGIEFENELIKPLFHFRNLGTKLPTTWTTISNGSIFLDDYKTRTAVARSNIFVNRPEEARYFYLETDGEGNELDGNHSYTIHFAPTDLPENKGFWSLTLYDQDHRLIDVPPHHQSIVSTSPQLSRSTEEKISIHIQSIHQAVDPSQHNLLIAPPGKFVLYLRVYSPDGEVARGNWAPPPLSNRLEPSSRLVKHNEALTVTSSD